MAPKNATVRGDGFRVYQWPGGDTELNRKYNAVEPADLLSVTSIKSLAGESFQLVAWKIANVVNIAMGVRKETRIGPRGGVKEVYVKDGPFPGEFVARMIASDGKQDSLDENRKWLRAAADEPRDIAAVRGTIVHKMIELGLPLSMVDEDMIRNRFDLQWKEERRRVPPEVTEHDVNFVMNAMRQYWDMRSSVPFVIIAQEPQVFNLTVGYGGSADALLWFLGTFEQVRVGADENDEDVYETVFVPIEGEDPAKWQKAANKGLLTLADIERIGGTLAVGDWKTSKSVYTAHIVQTVAYMSGEFIAEDSLIDERLTAILRRTSLGLVIHIRPDQWGVEFFDYREDILTAFIGSAVYARFLAQYKEPTALFTHSVHGKAPETEDSEVTDDE